jgi:hypothetical protein
LQSSSWNFMDHWRMTLRIFVLGWRELFKFHDIYSISRWTVKMMSRWWSSRHIVHVYTENDGCVCDFLGHTHPIKAVTLVWWNQDGHWRSPFQPGKLSTTGTFSSQPVWSVIVSWKSFFGYKGSPPNNRGSMRFNN